ncbi:hypothetical protein ALTERO38_60596 [Alteromonas sp. 38]|nr:hypothetical protein ALTER154_40199 [Alteromonas sp. 154]VXC27112.1 hypothetical protein ALTERO38_60596 [Alteromonas sp. 38]
MFGQTFLVVIVDKVVLFFISGRLMKNKKDNNLLLVQEVNLKG